MVMPVFAAGQKVTGAQLNQLSTAVDTLVTQVALLTAPSWSTITLSASWTNRATYAVASYRKILGGAAMHIVLNITGGTTTNGTTIFTLPVGSRPLTVVQIPIVTRIAAAPQQMGALEIDTTGAAKIYDIGASATIHTNGIIPLDL